MGEWQAERLVRPAWAQWARYLRPTAKEQADHDVLLSSLDELSDAERAHFHAWRGQRGLFMLLDTFEQWEDWQEAHEDEFESELLDERVQAWSLNGMPAQPPTHTTTWAEFLEHCGGPRQPLVSRTQLIRREDPRFSASEPSHCRRHRHRGIWLGRRTTITMAAPKTYGA